MFHVLAVALLLVGAAELTFTCVSAAKAGAKMGAANLLILTMFVAAAVGVFCLMGSWLLWPRLAPLVAAVYGAVLITSLVFNSARIIRHRKSERPH